MRPVTQRRIPAVFAATEKDFLAAVCRVLDRFELCVFMRSIAKRLPFGSAACTPEIAFPFDHLDREGTFLRDGGAVRHVATPSFADVTLPV